MNRILILLSLVLFYSCGENNVVFSESKPMDGLWKEGEAVSFNLPELDSLKSYNLFLNIRNTNDYQYNNLFLIVTMNFPHGKTVVDTLEYRMANPDGSWMGYGIGSIKESKLWYKEHVRFMEEGEYVVQIEQAMRNKGEIDGVLNLHGIADVGFTIEEITN
ncbi:MAG TPA: gliding motility lipoprotein GldH [Flavobacteriaceae bacterium]|nr:gliding motility lipoprotein GldH [Flavobacteriaceae bacterium]